MMKKEFGGVLNKNLFVYDVEKLSIIDESVIPPIPGTHPSAMLYAVSETVSFILYSFLTPRNNTI